METCDRCQSKSVVPAQDESVQQWVCLVCGWRLYGPVVNPYSDRHRGRDSDIRGHEEMANQRRQKAGRLWQQGKDRHEIADRLGVSHRSTYRYV